MSFLTNLWQKILRKLGVLAGFIKPIADEMSIAISEGDVAKVRALNAKLREKFTDGLAVCDKVDEVIADDKLTITEGSELALAIEAMVD